MNGYNSYSKKLSVSQKLKLHFLMESTGLFRYFFENLIQFLLNWVPSILGIGLRFLFYRMVIKLEGKVVIQAGCIFKQSKNIMLKDGVYIDHRVYMHATLGGIVIGENSRIMFNAELHVHNYNAFPEGKISIGKNTVIGPFSVIMGHGGTTIGNNVIIGPRVSILPVNHLYDDPMCPIRDQGVSSQGIVIENDAWIGAGVNVLDGVRVGQGSVIGAGAVVTKDIAPYSLVVGVPAKVIRTWAPPKNKDK